MRVAITNQKGGVGKTAVALGLASAARAAGQPSLVVDLDPQGSATWTLGVADEHAGGVAAAVDANRKGAAADFLTDSAWGGDVRVLAASRQPVVPPAEAHTKRGVQRLSRALAGVDDDRSITIIDCPPSLGPRAAAGLTAADVVVIVVEPSAHSLRGLAAVLDFVDDVWDRFHPDLDLGGVIVNKVPASSSEAERQVDELGRMVGKRTIWKPAIPSRVVVNEALGARQPIHDTGWRGREVSEVFDKLYAKARRAR